MKVTYTGIEDIRRITSADFPDLDSFDDLVWKPGETQEVPDTLGERLTELDRRFENREGTTRDLRSKEELYELAQELEIKGRSSMSREELLEAITAQEAQLEDEAALESINDGKKGDPST